MGSTEATTNELDSDCVSVDWTLNMRRKCCRFFSSSNASQHKPIRYLNDQMFVEAARMKLLTRSGQHLSADHQVDDEDVNSAPSNAKDNSGKLRKFNADQIKLLNELEATTGLKANCQSDNLSALSASSSLLSQLLNSSLNQLIEIDNGSSASPIYERSQIANSTSTYCAQLDRQDLFIRHSGRAPKAANLSRVSSKRANLKSRARHSTRSGILANSTKSSSASSSATYTDLAEQQTDAQSGRNSCWSNSKSRRELVGNNELRDPHNRLKHSQSPERTRSKQRLSHNLELNTTKANFSSGSTLSQHLTTQTDSATPKQMRKRTSVEPDSLLINAADQQQQQPQHDSLLEVSQSIFGADQAEFALGAQESLLDVADDFQCCPFCVPAFESSQQMTSTRLQSQPTVDQLGQLDSTGIVEEPNKEKQLKLASISSSVSSPSSACSSSCGVRVTTTDSSEDSSPVDQRRKLQKSISIGQHHQALAEMGSSTSSLLLNRLGQTQVESTGTITGEKLPTKTLLDKLTVALISSRPDKKTSNEENQYEDLQQSQEFSCSKLEAQLEWLQNCPKSPISYLTNELNNNSLVLPLQARMQPLAEPIFELDPSAPTTCASNAEEFIIEARANLARVVSRDTSRASSLVSRSNNQEMSGSQLKDEPIYDIPSMSLNASPTNQVVSESKYVPIVNGATQRVAFVRCLSPDQKYPNTGRDLSHLREQVRVRTRLARPSIRSTISEEEEVEELERDEGDEATNLVTRRKKLERSKSNKLKNAQQTQPKRGRSRCNCDKCINLRRIKRIYLTRTESRPQTRQRRRKGRHLQLASTLEADQSNLSLLSRIAFNGSELRLKSRRKSRPALRDVNSMSAQSDTCCTPSCCSLCCSQVSAIVRFSGRRSGSKTKSRRRKRVAQVGSSSGCCSCCSSSRLLESTSSESNSSDSPGSLTEEYLRRHRTRSRRNSHERHARIARRRMVKLARKHRSHRRQYQVSALERRDYLNVHTLINRTHASVSRHSVHSDRVHSSRRRRRANKQKTATLLGSSAESGMKTSTSSSDLQSSSESSRIEDLAESQVLATSYARLLEEQSDAEAAKDYQLAAIRGEHLHAVNCQSNPDQTQTGQKRVELSRVPNRARRALGDSARSVVKLHTRQADRNNYYPTQQVVISTGVERKLPNSCRGQTLNKCSGREQKAELESSGRRTETLRVKQKHGHNSKCSPDNDNHLESNYTTSGRAQNRSNYRNARSNRARCSSTSCSCREKRRRTHRGANHDRHSRKNHVSKCRSTARELDLEDVRIALDSMRRRKRLNRLLLGELLESRKSKQLRAAASDARSETPFDGRLVSRTSTKQRLKTTNAGFPQRRRRQLVAGSSCSTFSSLKRNSYLRAERRQKRNSATMNQLRAMQKALIASRFFKVKPNLPNLPRASTESRRAEANDQLMSRFLVKTLTSEQLGELTKGDQFERQMARQCQCSHCCLVDKFIRMDLQSKRRRKLDRG